eukprot:513571-Rhodomonas_salina.2
MHSTCSSASALTSLRSHHQQRIAFPAAGNACVSAFASSLRVWVLAAAAREERLRHARTHALSCTFCALAFHCAAFIITCPRASHIGATAPADQITVDMIRATANAHQLCAASRANFSERSDHDTLYLAQDPMSTSTPQTTGTASRGSCVQSTRQRTLRSFFMVDACCASLRTAATAL